MTETEELLDDIRLTRNRPA